MPMFTPWSVHEQPNRSIEVRCEDEVCFILNWVQALGQWELRRAGESKIIERDQYRNDLFSGIQSGRIK